MQLILDDLTTDETFASFVEAFEQCALPKASWTHAAHVAVATNYLLDDRSTALSRIRTNIQRFNESVGGINSDTSGYHETLTVFWLNVLAAYVDQETPAARMEIVKRAVSQFGSDSKLHARFYSFDVVNSTQARRCWVAPDAEKLPELVPAAAGPTG